MSVLAAGLLTLPMLQPFGCGSRDTVTHEMDGDAAELTKLAFDPEAIKTISGRILRVESYQKVERSRFGVRLLLDSDGTRYYVYLAPARFLDESGFEPTKGREVQVTGSIHEGDGRLVIIARSIEADGVTIALRDESGRPEWRAWKRRT